MIQSPNSTAMLQLYYIKATIISTILKNDKKWPNKNDNTKKETPINPIIIME